MTVTLHQGDCLEVLRSLLPESVDSVVTDPPAGISFMGKDWDSAKGGRSQWVSWMTDVMRECLRVLKPGGHALVWAIPRTSHWTGQALEDAGFEIRDVVTHLFGSGFPKSLDISKAIDKAAGAEGPIIGANPAYRARQLEHDAQWSTAMRPEHKRGPATDAARQWQGFGTALKPAVEFWWLCRKPLSEKTVAQNVLKWGTGGLNIDASRILSDAKRPDICPACSLPVNVAESNSTGSRVTPQTSAASDATAKPENAGSTTRSVSQIPKATSDSSTGTTHVANMSTSSSTDMSGSGLTVQSQRATSYTTRTKLNPTIASPTSCSCLAQSTSACTPENPTSTQQSARPRTTCGPTGQSLGRFPSNLVLTCCGNEPHDEDCAAHLLDLQSGIRPGDRPNRKPRKNTAAAHNLTASMGKSTADWETTGHSDTGGASRFFYVAKASKSDRNRKAR